VLNPLRLGSGLVEAFTWLEANHRQVGAFGLRARSRVVEGYSLDDHWEGLDGIVETLRLR
jgi:hypothetical protein